MKIGIYGLILVCCIWGQALGQSQHFSSAKLIHQDANLYQVDNKLFRSEQLNKKNQALIQSLNIQSIVNLRYFNRHKDSKLFQNNGINLINQPLLTWNVQPEHIAHILWTIEQQQKHGAVLVHCYHGADRTGIIIAMYRIIYQGWHIEQAKREMQQGGFGYHSVWQNLEDLLTENNVHLVQLELRRLRDKNAE